MAKLVYIGGYGRSGSTLLEYLMTVHSGVLACGEVASCLRKKAKLNKKCTCGKRVRECPVWCVFDEHFRQSGGWTHEKLSLAMLASVSGHYAVMIDSSKTAWGSMTAPFHLRRKLGEDFQLIHLVRNPRAVCWSTVSAKRSRALQSNPTLRCAWTTIGWCAANLASEIFGWMHPRAYVRVRYEDVARCPHESIQRLIQKLLPGLSWEPADIGMHNNRHQLHGNRMRRQLVTFADVREDMRWASQMPAAHRHMVEWLSWPLRGRYGYP